MNTQFRVHLYDIHYDVYKDDKLITSVDVPVDFYSEFILCFKEEDPLSPKGFSYKYFYHYFLMEIGLIPTYASINDFRTSTK